MDHDHEHCALGRAMRIGGGALGLAVRLRLNVDGELPPAMLAETRRRVDAEVVRIVERVQGNRPDGSPMGPGDVKALFRALLEAALEELERD